MEQSATKTIPTFRLNPTILSQPSTWFTFRASGMWTIFFSISICITRRNWAAGGYWPQAHLSADGIHFPIPLKLGRIDRKTFPSTRHQLGLVAIPRVDYTNSVMQCRFIVDSPFTNFHSTLEVPGGTFWFVEARRPKRRKNSQFL